MNKLIFTISILACSNCLFAQDGKVQHIKIAKEDTENIFFFTEQEAIFDEKNGSLSAYISRSIIYPKEALDSLISGRVYMKFVVEKDGSITNVSIVKGISDSPEINAEALRVIKEMPMWKPAKNGGKAVRSWHQIPINFTLN
ncbi:MAG: energy transducer TonB [Flavobacteriia bacterium]